MKTLERSKTNSGGRGLFPSFRPGSHFISSIDEVHGLVEAVISHGSFAFDVETVGVMAHHPDLTEQVDIQVEEHVKTLSSATDSMVARTRETKEQAMTKNIALDPKRNEVIWLSLIHI